MILAAAITGMVAVVAIAVLIIKNLIQETLNDPAEERVARSVATFAQVWFFDAHPDPWVCMREDKMRSNRGIVPRPNRMVE